MIYTKLQKILMIFRARKTKTKKQATECPQGEITLHFRLFKNYAPTKARK